jgi:hypothetical protein
MFDAQGHVQRSKSASGAAPHGVLERSMVRISPKVPINSTQDDVKLGCILVGAILSHQMLIDFFRGLSPILAVV